MCRPASGSSETEESGRFNNQTLGIVALVGGLAVVLGLGYLFKGKVRHFLDYFIERVDEWGPWGYVAYGALYTALEIVALPAIPLTMTAGVLFGIVPGTIVVSGAATTAATIAFLIARYAARDKVCCLSHRNVWQCLQVKHVLGSSHAVQRVSLSPHHSTCMLRLLYIVGKCSLSDQKAVPHRLQACRQQIIAAQFCPYALEVTL